MVVFEVVIGFGVSPSNGPEYVPVLETTVMVPFDSIESENSDNNLATFSVLNNSSR